MGNINHNNVKPQQRKGNGKSTQKSKLTSRKRSSGAGPGGAGEGRVTSGGGVIRAIRQETEKDWTPNGSPNRRERNNQQSFRSESVLLHPTSVAPCGCNNTEYCSLRKLKLQAGEILLCDLIPLSWVSSTALWDLRPICPLECNTE